MFLVVTGTIGHMLYNADQRQRIGHAVGRKRIAAGLSKEEASERARINSITWKRIEDGESVRDASLGKVLGTLGLDPDVVLGEPTPTVSLRDASNDELLGELATRLDRSSGGVVRTDDAQEPPNWGRGFRSPASRDSARVSGDQ